MNRRPLAHSELELSDFCYGTIQFGNDMSLQQSDRLMDLFRGAGGNFFDTAHCYNFWQPGGAGSCERILGDYVKRNGCRDEVIIATKGAHPGVPEYRKVEQYMTAGRIAADLDDSLGRLQVDVIDLYWLHRDDPRIPVSEILGILNDEVKRGRIRYFAGSNWTSQRLAEANTYAQAHGMDGFVASQPRWNLACDPDAETESERLKPEAMLSLSRRDAQWHEQSQIAVIPYSSTAQGFFATNGKAAGRYATGYGLERLKRVNTLAAQTGTSPAQLALAWLLHQPFPVFPLIGTGDAEHLAEALAASDVTLSADQMEWLGGCGKAEERG